MRYEVSIGDDYTTFVHAGNPYQAGLVALDEFINTRYYVPRDAFIVQNLENNSEEVIPLGVLLNIKSLSNNYEPDWETKPELA